MKTDIPFYTFLRDYPATVFRALGLTDLPPEAYEFKSLSVKEQAFNLDGVYMPKAPEQSSLPILFLEVYFYKYAKAYLKITLETLLYIRQFDERPDALMLLLFAKREHDPGDKMLDILQNTPYLRVYYLEEIIGHLPDDDPYLTGLK